MLEVPAFDFGASSGRAILGGFDGERLVLSEFYCSAQKGEVGIKPPHVII